MQTQKPPRAQPESRKRKKPCAAFPPLGRKPNAGLVSFTMACLSYLVVVSSRKSRVACSISSIDVCRPPLPLLQFSRRFVVEPRPVSLTEIAFLITRLED